MRKSLNIIFVERVLIWSTLVLLLLPLSLNLSYFRLYTWNIPALLLIPIILLRISYSSKSDKLRIDIWDISIQILIGLLFVFTSIGEKSQSNFPLMTQYCSALIFAFYIRRAWRKQIITTKDLIYLAVFGILIQSSVGLLQQITSSQLGNPKAFFGESQNLSLEQSFGIELSRVQGTLGQPNLVANWIIFLFPYLLISNLEIKNKLIVFLKPALILLAFFGLILTLSRANIGFFVLLNIIFGYSLYLKKSSGLSEKKFINRGLLIVVITIGALTLFASNFEFIAKYYFGLNERFVQIISSDRATGTADWRIEMNKGALQMIQKNNLFGIGFNNSGNIWTSVDTQIPFWWNYRPHNVYLVFGVESGVIGFLAYSIITILPLILTFKYRKKGGYLTSAIMFSLLASFLISQVYLTPLQPEFAVLNCIIIGLAMGQIDLLKKIRYD